MTIVYQNELTNPGELIIHDPAAEVVVWQEREALKLNGLAVVPDLSITEGCLEVDIGTDEAAYPGLVFRLLDVLNYELVYTQPHTSGKWDALQYDPVFHGSNTWQLYYGTAFQRTAEIPLGNWFKFRVDFKDNWAVARVGEQAPLVVHRLAHKLEAGLIGVWTYLPAHFRDLQVSVEPSLTPASVQEDRSSSTSPETVMEWFIEGFGKVECEPHGALNLNRFFSPSAGEVRLSRWIETLAEDEVEMEFGFSDKLTLKVDDETVFLGENLYKSSPNWADRGYIEPTMRVRHTLPSGRHRLTAILSATEYFGWGLTLNLIGGQSQLLPACWG